MTEARVTPAMIIAVVTLLAVMLRPRRLPVAVSALTGAGLMVASLGADGQTRARSSPGAGPGRVGAALCAVRGPDPLEG
jgi:hypothetical protein